MPVFLIRYGWTEKDALIRNFVMLGPNVAIYTAGHPLDKETGNAGYEFGKSIRIENTCRVVREM